MPKKIINYNNNNNNNISKAPFPNGPKVLFTRLKIQIYNNTLKKLKDN